MAPRRKPLAPPTVTVTPPAAEQAGVPGVPVYSARERVRRLLDHRYTQQFQRHVGLDGSWYELAAGTATGKRRTCTGLLARSRRAFYPTYNRISAMRMGKAAVAMQRAAGGTGSMRGKTPRRCAAYGRGQASGRSSVGCGKRLDNEIRHIVNCLGGDPRGKAEGAPCECASVPRRTRCPRSGEMLWHAWTMQYLRECKARDITLLRSQVMVGSPMNRLCTDIDDVGVQYEGTPRERLLAIERKTGNTGEALFAPCGYLEPPFPQCSSTVSSKFNHDQLQPKMAQQMVNQGYAAAGIRIDSTYVVYLSRNAQHADAAKRGVCEWYGPRGWWAHEADRRLLFAKLCRA
jgi:hypothetical protein